MTQELLYPAKSAAQDANARHYLIYFITGNPGLIDYYEPFLSHLRSLLDETEKRSSAALHIYGRNLAGFDDADHEPFTASSPPHDVDYQVKSRYEHLSSMRIPSGPRQGQPFDEVIVMGHSVGTYITLELFHRHLRDPSAAPHLNLKVGILLFASISHIAKSPSGIFVSNLLRVPFLEAHAHQLAKGFLSLWPVWALTLFIRRVMGFPPHAVAATVRFLTSRDGVWQGIHMGKDEMNVISEDRWADELWEVADEALAHKSEMPKFFFFFAKQDHWVANECRDEFIQKREEHANRDAPATKRGRTRIVVDEGDLPHDFCIREFHF